MTILSNGININLLAIASPALVSNVIVMKFQHHSFAGDSDRNTNPYVMSQLIGEISL